MLSWCALLSTLLGQASSGQEKAYRVDTDEGLTVVVVVSDDKTPKTGTGVVVSREGMTLLDRKDEKIGAVAAVPASLSDIKLERTGAETALATNISATPVLIFVLSREPGATARIVGAAVFTPQESGRISFGSAVYAVTAAGQVCRLVFPELPQKTGWEEPTEWHWQPWDEPFHMKDLTLGACVLWVPRFYSKIHGTLTTPDNARITIDNNTYSQVGFGAFAEMDWGWFQTRVSFSTDTYNGKSAATVVAGQLQTIAGMVGTADTRGAFYALQFDLTRNVYGYTEEGVDFEIEVGGRLGYVREDLLTIGVEGVSLELHDRETWFYGGGLLRSTLKVHLISQIDIDIGTEAFLLSNLSFGVGLEAGLTLRF